MNNDAQLDVTFSTGSLTFTYQYGLSLIDASVFLAFSSMIPEQEYLPRHSNIYPIDCAMNNPQHETFQHYSQ